MSATLTTVVVIRFARTPQAHLHAAVTAGTLSPVMEGLASISTNVLLILTVVAKAVPTLLGLSLVPVSVDSL